MQSVIEVRGLQKSYGDVHAVQGIDFEVKAGEIFAMLGPNGAGKSTTVEILEGLRARDKGELSVLGIDPGRDSGGLKSRIGVALQSTAFPGKIRVVELIELYGRLYRSRPNTKKLLERFELADKAKAFFETLSGGQQQKLALILAMINDPPLVFLDEPSSGLDAHTRRTIHDWLRELRAQGRTVFLTTHYIHEAEQLSDRVAILRRGKIVKQGTIADLATGLSLQSEVRFRMANATSVEKLASLPGVASADQHDGTYILKVTQPADAISELVRYLDSTGNRLADIEVSRPTLEDLFLKLTGEQTEEPS
jgi:ABC-2 type transport system ATP-binding protein